MHPLRKRQPRRARELRKEGAGADYQNLELTLRINSPILFTFTAGTSCLPSLTFIYCERIFHSQHLCCRPLTYFILSLIKVCIHNFIMNRKTNRNTISFQVVCMEGSEDGCLWNASASRQTSSGPGWIPGHLPSSALSPSSLA